MATGVLPDPPESSGTAEHLNQDVLPASSDWTPDWSDDWPVIPTDEFGMIVANDDSTHSNVSAPVKQRKTRQPRKYVSNHFSAVLAPLPTRPTPPPTPAQPTPTTNPGFFNIDDLSSDSTLTDVPSDIGSDPFDSPSPEPPKVKGVKVKQPTKSPYFPNKKRPQFLSCLPFPPLSETTFGLMQERLAHDPFWMLIATIFLNKTPGERAMPVFYQLMEKYPTIEALANAEVADVTAIIRHLGFQNQRAVKCVGMAKKWLETPPERNRRRRKLHYPRKGDGRDVAAEEVIEDVDPRVAWEISHLPGLGPYSHDSWRMFCRDELRGVATSWLGDDAQDPDFEPEWKRVLPLDKELRAYLTWKWLQEGWVWNKETGKRDKATEELMDQARGGGVMKEEVGKEHLVVSAVVGLDVGKCVGKPAGDFMPFEHGNDVKASNKNR